ncbi:MULTISPECIES: DNA-formamidopyrimidine glycosylase [unclassified Breznakia]|uniref:DNA-formamidopyrimidine glycosylase n=1 Tax=unclassified Breznakia TaxID=2623764 RepID=UPI0024753687|nr:MULTISPECIES: DNA-formamidopyrimidine glycosylase [unclassified Breznakia]MDH6366444.1 formamidopyrimidine-DNA glycosylase [Breznakia sp. PH1-1]MDH6403537.1 formamidopyrimidine-DNA glycosylase [Breznakia sp. PF1-11]MDH6411246.1 formamidopyrimidine-DNA glycosylase [Breznakia sp. PFB1-11]MDH6413491.1 formamidopyrimidine-DNA glycosylase [Breznakia sp. PFB1-14]MDH6415791.1 formamidopyrimidine-DNA glycosylase [Breznakia sp. PFB1-4]
MPELPEVETVLRTLEHQIKGNEIVHIEVRYAKMIDAIDAQEFTKLLVHQHFIDFSRVGKYLIFGMNDVNLVVHLRMEGKFYIYQKDEDPYSKHAHIIFTLDDSRKLVYHDVRKFGRMYVYDKDVILYEQKAFQHVGYDAFDSHVDANYLYQQAKKRKTTLKQFLLDQSVMAGVGNIYADEIAFRSKLHPETKIYHLTKKDFERILENTRIILQGAIKAGGTTIRSYTSSLGVDGKFQLQLKVHMKKGEACPICGNPIDKIVVGGRGTYVCRTCQKRK